VKKEELIRILEKEMGVDAANLSPFAPRVELVMGSQEKAPLIAGKLALCEKGALIFQPRGTSRFAATVSCKKVKLFFLLRKITDQFYNKKAGKWTWMPFFSDTWLALFGCTEDDVQSVALALGERGVAMMIIDDYRLIEPIIDKHSTMKKQKLPPRKGRVSDAT
jgi:hypothetical protein